MPHRETRGRNRPGGFFFPGSSHDFLSYELISWATFPDPAWAGLRPPSPTGKLTEETAPAVSSSQVPLTIFFHTNSSPGRRFPALPRRDCDLQAPQGNSRKKPPRRFLLPRSLSRFSFIRTHLLGDVSRSCLGGIATSMPHRETRGRNRPGGFFFPGPSHVFLS